MRINAAMVVLMLSLSVGIVSAQCTSKPKHECGKGPIKITKRYTETGFNRRPTCLHKVENPKYLNGDTLDTRTEAEFTTADWGIQYNTVVRYATDCERDVMYTDWPECGGQEMYRVSVPRDVQDCDCDCEKEGK